MYESKKWSFSAAVIWDLKCICHFLFYHLCSFDFNIWKFNNIFIVQPLHFNPVMSGFALYCFENNCIFLVSIYWSKILNFMFTIICKSSRKFLKHKFNLLYNPLFHFYTPWKHQKNKRFLTFLGNIEMEHWP